MTERETKAYLRRYRENEVEIRRLQEELTLWSSRAEKVTPSFGPAPGGGQSEGFPACVERMAELQAELAAALTQALELRREVAAAISALPDARARLLLRLRYIDGLTWERVAEKLGISYQWACALHAKAIEKLRDS